MSKNREFEQTIKSCLTKQQAESISFQAYFNLALQAKDAGNGKGISSIAMGEFAPLMIAAFKHTFWVVKEFLFRKFFFEMTIISLSVALFSFGIGFLIRQFFGVDL